MKSSFLGFKYITVTVNKLPDMHWCVSCSEAERRWQKSQVVQRVEMSGARCPYSSGRPPQPQCRTGLQQSTGLTGKHHTQGNHGTDVKLRLTIKTAPTLHHFGTHNIFSATALVLSLLGRPVITKNHPNLGQFHYESFLKQLGPLSSWHMIMKKKWFDKYCSCECFFLLFSQELGLSTQDVLLLYYGRASALTEIGKPEVFTVHTLIFTQSS